MGDATAPRVKLADRLAPQTTSTYLKVYPLKAQSVPRPKRKTLLPLRILRADLPPIH